MRGTTRGAAAGARAPSPAPAAPYAGRRRSGRPAGSRHHLAPLPLPPPAVEERPRLQEIVSPEERRKWPSRSTTASGRSTTPSARPPGGRSRPRPQHRGPHPVVSAALRPGRRARRHAPGRRPLRARADPRPGVARCPLTRFGPRRDAASGPCCANTAWMPCWLPHPPNVRYLSGFTGSNGMVLAGQGRRHALYGPALWHSVRPAETDCRVKVCRGPLLPDVIAAVEKRHAYASSVSNGRASPSTPTITCNRELPLKTSLEPVAGRWSSALVKSAGEMELIRLAVQTNSQAFEQAMRRAGPGTGERPGGRDRLPHAAAGRREAGLRDHRGGRRALGPAPRLTHRARVRPRDAVVVDMGAHAGRLCQRHDPHVVCGDCRGPRRSGSTARCWRRNRRPSTPCARVAAASAVDRAARRVLQAYRLRTAPSSTPPGTAWAWKSTSLAALGKREKLLLRAGMVITIEPGAYIEGFRRRPHRGHRGGDRKGCEVLTPTGKELRIV